MRNVQIFVSCYHCWWIKINIWFSQPATVRDPVNSEDWLRNGVPGSRAPPHKWRFARHPVGNLYASIRLWRSVTVWLRPHVWYFAQWLTADTESLRSASPSNVAFTLSQANAIEQRGRFSKRVTAGCMTIFRLQLTVWFLHVADWSASLL